MPPRTGKRGRPRKFCTDRCTRAAHRYPDSHSRTCSEPDCDRPVRARGICQMHLRRVYRAEGRERPPEWSERRRSNWKKRKAAKRGAEAENFVYRDIFERDGWACGICAEPVSPDLAYPDPMSASLDHIVPLSKGGTHAAENVQCAHLVCNLRKGARAA